MANQQAISGVAGALENLARALKERRLDWDPRTQQTVIRTVDDLKVFVRQLGSWGEAENENANKLAREVNTLAGVAPTQQAEREDAGVDAGTRAFIAREAAAAATALDQLARGLQRGGTDPEQLEHTLRAMQPLRGLATLADLSPMPEFLDGVERAVGIALSGDAKAGDLAVLFDVAARGLTGASRDITTSGATRPDSPEAREFARRLGALLDAGSTVVPIQSLYYEDGGPDVVSPGTQPAGPGRFARMEIVAHGEHLRQAADELERAQWDTQRELRALALTSTFRSLVTASGGALEDAVARFADAARGAVSRGVPVHETDAFVAQLRNAGIILSDATEAKEEDLAGRLSDVTSTIASLAGAPAEAIDEVAEGAIHRPPAPSAALATEDLRPEPTDDLPAFPADDAEFTAHPALVAPEVVEVPSALDLPGLPEFEEVEPDQYPAVDAGAAESVTAAPEPSAAPHEQPFEPPAIGSPVEPWEPPATLEEPGAEPVPREQASALTESWTDYEQSQADRGTLPGSLDELLGGPTPADPDVVPASSMTEPPEEERTVSITDLLYRGSAALERAQEIREQIKGNLGQPDLPEPHLAALVDELVDLVQLGQHAEK
jgi:hypothetical protein